ncbi:hypothetical protein [Dysosmobacter welbionis]|uniref:hypothetical protein n=1 Tax=Dysosmobacter welbionis TaxID=2093857 RepID=UPI00210B986B|nr:hypothetical protein [Dysosmobacter welbionis]MCQ5045631.1 hypothetical protein [Dysosmobacter welbionis]
MDENRHRHTVWMDDAVWDQVESRYQRDNCSTRNEFIEKAVQFYSGYLDTESADAYLPKVLADILEGKLGALGKRIGHLLFKLSVDQNLMGNVLAAGIDIDPDELRKARVRCVKEVKETNGEISFEDAVRYQKGAE